MIGFRMRNLSRMQQLNHRGTQPVIATALLAGVLASALAGCMGSGTTDGIPQTLTVWRHDGTGAESRVFAAQVQEFNAAHPQIKVQVRTIAEGDYNDELQAGVAGRNLPDIVEIDGPLLASYAYQDQLIPLDSLLPQEIFDQQLTSLKSQGTIKGQQYAVGAFDSGLGLYADRRQLRAAGIRTWPTTAEDAWTSAEFGRVLARLAAYDSDHKVLDVKLNYGTGEWLTYGFAPLVASTGGELIDSATLSAEGHLNGPATRHALSTLATWAPYVDPNPKDDTFQRRRVALSWVGHWAYPQYAKALGPDLLVLPLPDLGHGTKSGQGSWAWSVTRSARHSDDASTFISYLLGTDQILRMVDANGAVPGSRPALERSHLYGSQGPLRLFAEQLLADCGTDKPNRSCIAVPRPQTPAYRMLSAQFATAVHASLTGSDWAEALNTGAERVKRDFDANGGYR